MKTTVDERDETQPIKVWKGLLCHYGLFPDGTIRQNHGDGYKRWKRLKAGVTIEQFLEKQEQRELRREPDIPAFVAYERAMVDEFPLEIRAMAHTIIHTMPQDPDGVWAELADYGHECSFETVQSLCNLLLAAERESDERRNQQAAETQPQETRL